jgi:hypothetical protein
LRVEAPASIANFILTLGDLGHGRLRLRIFPSLQMPLAALPNLNSRMGIVSPAPSPSCGALVGFPSGPVWPGDRPSYWHHQGDTSSTRSASAVGWQATSHRHGPTWFPCTGGRVLPVHATCPGGRPPATHPDTRRFRPMRWVQVDPASSLPFPPLPGATTSPGSSIQENPCRSTASAPLLLHSATLRASAAPLPPSSSPYSHA